MQVLELVLGWTLAKEVSQDITQQQRCNKCEAYQIGNKQLIKRSMGHDINTRYQIKIANSASQPLTFKSYTPYVADGNKEETTPIKEWKLAGVNFDGLWPLQCVLVEAKGDYGQFLDGSKPNFLVEKIFQDMVGEISSHQIVKKQYKSVQLNWYFYQKEAKAYFDKIAGPIIKTIHMPI